MNKNELKSVIMDVAEKVKEENVKEEIEKTYILLKRHDHVNSTGFCRFFNDKAYYNVALEDSNFSALSKAGFKRYIEY